MINDLEDSFVKNPSYNLTSPIHFAKALEDDEMYHIVTAIKKGPVIHFKRYQRVWFLSKDNDVLAAITHKNLPFVILDDESNKSINDLIEQDVEVNLPNKEGIIYSQNPKTVITKKGDTIKVFEVHIKGWKFSDFQIK